LSLSQEKSPMSEQARRSRKGTTTWGRISKPHPTSRYTGAKSAIPSKDDHTPDVVSTPLAPPSTRQPHFYLFKSEPDTRLHPRTGQEMKFSIEDLEQQPNQRCQWDGVRNYQARNILREMCVGDRGFFYHSNCKNPGIVGIVSVVSEASPDPTQFDSQDGHYDPKSDPEQPKWVMVEVQLEHKLKRKVSLEELKRFGRGNGPLSGMVLLRSGRLSVQNVSRAEFEFVVELSERDEDVKKCDCPGES